MSSTSLSAIPSTSIASVKLSFALSTSCRPRRSSTIASSFFCRSSYFLALNSSVEIEGIRGYNFWATALTMVISSSDCFGWTSLQLTSYRPSTLPSLTTDRGCVSTWLLSSPFQNFFSSIFFSSVPCSLVIVGRKASSSKCFSGTCSNKAFLIANTASWYSITVVASISSSVISNDTRVSEMIKMPLRYTSLRREMEPLNFSSANCFAYMAICSW
mmetsp:Transcript_3304/g.7332  ORF Transcript_3304/g.7332 Transcript_3304/m.7332 type:complete len:215 (-) Transcript_3304:492-1136(-)